MAGTRKLAVRWLGPATGLVTQQAKDGSFNKK
jgi:hypothetical protein